MGRWRTEGGRNTSAGLSVSILDHHVVADESAPCENRRGVWSRQSQSQSQSRDLVRKKKRHWSKLCCVLGRKETRRKRECCGERGCYDSCRRCNGRGWTNTHEEACRQRVHREGLVKKQGEERRSTRHRVELGALGRRHNRKAHAGFRAGGRLGRLLLHGNDGFPHPSLAREQRP